MEIEGPSVVERDAYVIDRVARFVEDHYADGISLRHVASAMSYSPAHLTYLFRRVTGKPLNAWIIECRIREARRLLNTTDLPIGDVCDAVGFGDLCYFSRQFHRHTGTTPRRYRASFKMSTRPCNLAGDVKSIAVATLFDTSIKLTRAMRTCLSKETRL